MSLRTPPYASPKHKNNPTSLLSCSIEDQVTNDWHTRLALNAHMGVDIIYQNREKTDSSHSHGSLMVFFSGRPNRTKYWIYSVLFSIRFFSVRYFKKYWSEYLQGTTELTVMIRTVFRANSFFWILNFFLKKLSHKIRKKLTNNLHFYLDSVQFG